jgi:RsiW-degrading membrane proteinase PrsW (M82 family)/ribosomal protein S18 acetylase RimI-like enzyme
MTGAQIVLRQAAPSDFDLLSAVLLDATNWDGRRGLTVQDIRNDPRSWRYLQGWQQPTDFGVVAMDGAIPVGAAWARFFTRTAPGYGYVSDAIPEVTMAVAAGRRHEGLGRQLLDGLVRLAFERGLAGLSLSVEDGNRPARSLYASFGFVPAGRVGGSDTMVLWFPRTAAASTTQRLRPPKKWLGRFGGWIILGVMLGFWLINILFDQIVDHHVALSPNSLVLGGFGMTSALVYTMAYRLRAQDGITPLRLVLAFLAGGLLSTELAIFIEYFVGILPVGSPSAQSLLVRSLAGVIEEGCKLLVVVIAARGLAVRTARTGLFMGGAVGLGFAAYEDMRYAAASLLDLAPGHSALTAVLSVTLGRDLIGPLEHPILSALIASALFAATRDGRFRITPAFVGVFLVLAAVHGLIDAVPLLITDALGPVAGDWLGLLVGVMLAIGLGIAWLIYTRRVRRKELADGLQQPVAVLQ